VNELEIMIPGAPRGKERPRFNKNSRTVYTPSDTREYQELVGWHGRLAIAGSSGGYPHDRRVVVSYEIHHGISYMKAPDADNVVKAINDGLQKVIWANDRQCRPVVDVIKYKSRYPRVMVTIRDEEE
jgi:Holliday junction resolvase RusA-like endonuclease